MKPVRSLHLGCGNVFLPGYLNVDISNSFSGIDGPDLVADIRALWTLKTGEFDEIYACHVLEHIEWKDIVLALRDWRRLLRPGGILKISTPDLDAEIDHYLKARKLDWADRPNLGGVSPHWTPLTPSHQMVGTLVGGHEVSVGGTHQVPWNFEFLEEVLRQVGFTNIKRYESTLKDWSTKWPNSLNVVATADAAPIVHDYALQIENVEDILDLRPKIRVEPLVIGETLVFLRPGFQEDRITLPIDAKEAIDACDGKSTVRQIRERFETHPYISIEPEFFFDLVAKRVAEFHSTEKRTNNRVHYVLSPELQKEHAGKVLWPSTPGAKSAEGLQEFRLRDGVVLLQREKMGSPSGDTPTSSLLCEGEVIDLTADELACLRTLQAVGSITKVIEGPGGEELSDDTGKRRAAVHSLVARLLKAGMLE